MSFYAKEKKFDTVDARPSILGFGCMRLPLIKGTKEIDEESALEIIDYAYKNGVNYFDTAYPYHDGKSELFIGKALKRYERSSFYLADKMPTWYVKSEEDAIRFFNEQLEKCQVEYFDFYLCHSLTRSNYKAYENPGVMEFLYRMKEQGKIKHLGFSFHDSPEFLREVLEKIKFDFVQLQLNYIDWDLQRANEQYEIAREYGIPVIVMEPVRGGRLADLGELPNSILKEKNPNVSIASWALRYAAGKEQVMTVLSGMSNKNQVIDNINTMSDFKPLDLAEEEALDSAAKAFLQVNNFIPCTACRYCMDCPLGVDIPKNFDIHNNYAIDRDEKIFFKQYAALDSAAASKCVNCKKCISKCPQHIDIPKKMSEISSFIESIRDKYEQK